MVRVGDSLGDYEILARVKKGGMATLFLARRRGAAGFSRHVAIKVIHPHLAEDPAFVRMFVDEAKLSAQIEHPNVVHIEELGQQRHTYYLVMEYVHGLALSQVMQRLAQLGRRLSPPVVAWIAMRIAEGLHAAHELVSSTGEPMQVVHRDVSPQNVLISIRGHVKLIDFGIAKCLAAGHHTHTGSLKGKPAYMPPEQARGERIDRRADVYALGVVLWEMLTSRRLFAADNDFALLEMVRQPKVDPPSLYAPGLSSDLEDVVLAALAPEATNRIGTALELRNRLVEAVPEVGRLDSTVITELLGATMDKELDEAASRLPDSFSGVGGPDGERVTAPLTKPGGRPSLVDVLGTSTLPAPAPSYPVSEAEAASADDAQDTEKPAEDEQVSALPQSPPRPILGPRRLWMAVAAMVAIGLATYGAVHLSGAPPAESASRANEPARPATVDRAMIVADPSPPSPLPSVDTSMSRLGPDAGPGGATPTSERASADARLKSQSSRQPASRSKRSGRRIPSPMPTPEQRDMEAVAPTSFPIAAEDEF